MQILIAFASEHGQAAAVAAAIGAHLTRAGHRVDLVDSRRALPSPSAYDAVILGSRIQFERPAPRLRRYALRYREALAARPTAFFTVSMSASRASGLGRAASDVERFLAQVGWTPRWVAAFGGGVPYRRYGLLLRWLMKRIAAATGGPLDTTRNHDLTDWDAVARFAGQLAAGLAAGGDGARVS